MTCKHHTLDFSRRGLLARAGFGIGTAALAHLLPRQALASATTSPHAGLPGLPHFAPKAKRVICMFMSGGPSHLEMFDHKPLLDDMFDKDLPDSIRRGQRITGMVSGQARLPIQPSKFKFNACGKNGTKLGELIPYTQKVVDDICIIRSMHTEAINHDPAITFLQTGSQQPGRPSMGAWVDYGLGTENGNLPAFTVMCSVPAKASADQGILARLWGSGFLPGRHQGVQLRGSLEPIPYLNDPSGMTRARRRKMLDGLGALNRLEFERVGDPDIETRISQYEMAFRMQSSVPDLTDLSHESKRDMDMYGPDAIRPGSFARHCVLARRMLERGVRFVQLYHRGWDHHGSLHDLLPGVCKDTDQPAAALVQDLKQRGLLDDTLVIFAGEFGRTPYAQGGASRVKYGRDHHGKAFSLWLAGGGIKPGYVHGATDDFGFNVVDKPVHVHDLQATILHCLGIDHERLTYRYQGRQFRLTDVHGTVVKDVLA